MRRLLKHVGSREYFAQGRWTANPAEAQDFPDSGKAIATCLRYHLTDVELVLQLDAQPQDAYDTHLPLFDYGSGRQPQARD